MALQHLRSSTADKRPTPASMSDGQLAINTNLASPGLFFKDSNGDLVKVGPVHVGTTAPNVSPAGESGNSKGEQWLDTSSSKYVFKIWDGTAWRSEAGEFVDAAGDVMTGALGIIAGTAAAPGLYISGDTNTGLYSLGADQLALSTGGTGRLFIDDGGRIMAGVSTALTNAYAIGSALTPVVQIQGNTANGAALSITRNTSAAANLLLQRGVTGTPVVDTDAVGQISFNGFDGSNYFNAALIRGVVDGTPGTGSMPGRLSFQTTPTGSTTPVERLRLDPAGQIMAASLGTAALPVWSFTGDPNTGIYSPGADQVALSTGGTGRLFIDSAGLVGIGTSAPGTALQINNANDSNLLTLYRVANASDSECGILFKDRSVVGGGQDAARIFSLRQAALSNFDLCFATSNAAAAPATRMVIRADGKVGIGTTSPATTLHVKGADNSTIAYFDTELGGRGLKINTFVSGAAASAGVEFEAPAGANKSAFAFKGATEFMRIDTAGRLLVGTSSTSATSTAIFQNNSASSGPATVLFSTSTATPADGVNLGILRFSASNHVEAAQIVAQRDGGTWTAGSSQPTRLVFSTTADGASSPTERMRISQDGTILVTSVNTITDRTHAGFAGPLFAGSSFGGTIVVGQYSTGDRTVIDFRKNGVVAGSVVVTSAGATQYNTSSDYRLKGNIAPVTDGIDRAKQLKVVRFNYLSAPDIIVDGFLAHEVQGIVPEAVSGEKDAVDDEGNPVYQGIDQSKLVPLLTAALQEAIGRIETLEAEVAAFKAS